MNSSDNTLWGYRKFNISKFSFLYKDCFIRRITVDETEIIRAIYPAVRDQNWETIPMLITNTNVSSNHEQVSIITQVLFQEGIIDYQAIIEIVFTHDGNLKYHFDGIAKSDFLKNRIGLNMLLPVENVCGKHFTVKHSTGWEDGKFPVHISPHQPIKDIKTLIWEPTDQTRVEVHFHGDIFEMEDQRNWTDASFKIYSTPLSEPFPVLVRKNTNINQTICIKFNIQKENISHVNNNTYYSETEYAFPQIGLCVNPLNYAIAPEQLQTIKNINFDFIHLTVDIDNEVSYPQIQQAITYCNENNLPVKLSVIISENSEDYWYDRFFNILKQSNQTFFAVEVFDKKSFLTQGKHIEAFIKIIKEYFPSVMIGGGTYAYYAELNRSLKLSEGLDFISFSVSPQVHAFDDLTLFENLKGLEYAARDGAEKFKSSIHVGPITLKQRMNFVATSQESIIDPLFGYDQRQSEVLGALWTLGSIYRLALSGVKAASYFNISDIIHAPKKAIQKTIPLFYLFSEILKNKECNICPIKHYFPDIIDGFSIDNKEIWIWNYSSLPSEPVANFNVKQAYKFNFSIGLWEKVDDFNLKEISLFKFTDVEKNII